MKDRVINQFSTTDSEGKKYTIQILEEENTEKKPTPKPAADGSYIIRIHEQDLYADEKLLPWTDVKEDLQSHGLEVIKVAYSSFGACLFIQVKGTYTGPIPIYRLDTPSDRFNWTV